MPDVTRHNENELSGLQAIQGWNINPAINGDRMEELLASTEILKLIEEMQEFLKKSNPVVV
ncbi:MAG: hypothetical protein D3923_15240 [Candidatus Electrothrix sp. AR3]|nr:hypothetical protein [Candidatus Electrothrix sp. AR3]